MSPVSDMARPTEASQAGRLLELLLVLGLLLADLWSPVKLAVGLRVVVYSLIAGIVITSLGPRSPRFENVGASRLRALLITLALGLIVTAAGAWLREPHETAWRFLERKSPQALLFWMAGKVAVVAGQQFLLQRFVMPQCVELLRHRPAAQVVSAMLFGLIHLPNAALALMCGLAGWLWIRLFERSGRLLPVVASHLTLAILVHGLLPERVHLDMRVGRDAWNRLEELRQVDTSECRRWVAELAAPDYYARQGGTVEGFLKALYRDVLGRSPAGWEIEVWMNRAGLYDRSEIAEMFIRCEERRRRLHRLD